MEQQRIGGNRWVVLVPFPSQGHVNPMLDLGTVLHSRGFSILVVHTKFYSPNPSTHPDFLFQLLLGTSDGESASVNSYMSNLSALALDMNAKYKAPFKQFLANMMDQLKPHDQITCIIFDNIMYFSEDVASDMKIPSIILRPNNAITLQTFMIIPRLYAQGLIPLKDSVLEEPLAELYPIRFKDLSLPPPEALENMLRLIEIACRKTSSPIIWNTMDHLERNSLEKLHQHYQVPFFPIGPLHKMAQFATTSSLFDEDRSCISWLGKQAPNSVIYVSFGSLASMDEKSLVEMAWGLANSDQPFLWVVRPGSVSESQWIELLPENFHERIGERGYIVKWAPQKEVLAHEAVGGFFSHCGWNSTLESISEGVPMICWPYFGDQLVNSRCLREVWEIGLELKPELNRHEVERVVRRLMVEEEGKEIRQRALGFKEKIEVSVREGGSSYNSLDDLVKWIKDRDHLRY